MAASFARVAGTGTSTSNTTSVTVPISGVTAGNLLVLAVGIDKTSGALGATPAGWTLLTAQDGSSVSHAVFWKVAAGTETTVTATWTTAAPAGAGAAVHEFTGINPTTPVTAAATPAYDNAAATSFTVDPPASDSVPGGLAVVVAAVDTATAFPWNITGPGWTNRGSAGATGGRGTCALLTYDTQLAAGQDLGAQTFSTLESDQHTGSAFIIRAAAVSGGGGPANLDKLRLGAGTVGLRYGAAAVSKAYLGATQLWP